jgi:8-oxo-dGTP pyrophosphatase MutT (NUDIX family)
MCTLITAGLIVVKDRKLLLAFSNNKQAYYLPGGKTDVGETTKDTLLREIREELNVSLEAAQLQFYTHISAHAFGERWGTIMEQDCYFGHLPSLPQPSAEIAALDWFDTAAYRAQRRRASGVVMVMQQLRRDGLID